MEAMQKMTKVRLEQIGFELKFLAKIDQGI